MVRQVEVEKHRRSNMAHSSVNASAKKGGAGGSYTWGTAMQTVDYELFGIDFESIRITPADIPSSAPIAEHASFDVSLDDNDSFPSLSASTKAEEVCAPESAAPEEVGSDWVVVTPEADSPHPGADALVDAQHPLHQAERTMREGGVKERPMAIDWSQVGIPPKVTSGLPLDMLRAQNAASKQRPNSVSRQKSVPRSGSKPRMIKQPNGRR